MSRAIPRVKSAMTPFPFAIDADASLAEARAMMQEHGIHHLPVLGDGPGRSPTGVVCHRDLGEPGSGRTVRAAMRSPACVVDMEAPLEEVARSLAERTTDCILVTKEGRVAGIFTVTDACRSLAELLRERRETGGNDAA